MLVLQQCRLERAAASKHMYKL